MTTITAMPVTEDKLAAFVEAAQTMRNAYYAEQYPNSHRPATFTAESGKRYARIVCAEAPDCRSAFCFVDLDTGAILKADGWKRPAKQPRGTVHTATHGVEFLTPHGAQYLR